MAALLLVFALIAPLAGGDADARTGIGQTLDAWHAAAARADEDAYFAFFTPDAVFLGTDPAERWTRDEFRQWAHPALRDGQGVDDDVHQALDFPERGRQGRMVR